MHVESELVSRNGLDLRAQRKEEAESGKSPSDSPLWRLLSSLILLRDRKETTVSIFRIQTAYYCSYYSRLVLLVLFFAYSGYCCALRIFLREKIHVPGRGFEIASSIVVGVPPYSSRPSSSIVVVHRRKGGFTRDSQHDTEKVCSHEAVTTEDANIFHNSTLWACIVGGSVSFFSIMSA